MTRPRRQDFTHSGGALAGLPDVIGRLRPLVDEHVTEARVLHYLRELSQTPAPSTAASAMRGRMLRDLIEADRGPGDPPVRLDLDFRNTGSAVLTTGGGDDKGLWYFAHLDTISYLVQPRRDDGYPLVPFCYHLVQDGERAARAYRYDLGAGEYRVAAEGRLVSDAGVPRFVPDDGAEALRPGDRVAPVCRFSRAADGTVTGHFDNAGGVAALAVASTVLSRAGIDALLAFPDEEEGPVGSGSQMMGRGGSRIVAHLPSPDLAVVTDMQQAGGRGEDDGDRPENTTRLGRGAVLAEFSSLARGAVTPPHLYAAARHWADLVAGCGVSVQESNNAYTSRSDDVSVLLRTPDILLLGFPGFDRHFDHADPTANLADIVDLARSLVYVAALRPLAAALRRGERP